MRAIASCSGAVIALEAARRLPSITRLVVYEPPLYGLPHRMNLDLVERYNREVARSDVPAAMVSALLAPRRMLEPLIALAFRFDDRQKTRVYPPLRALVPSIRVFLTDLDRR